ncbi:MAG: outer membrane lipoprotein carrier protein LolA [Acidobacteria bacterium]|nr:outer membrane lipoprotein carrier protein LolA [Acidobacteriota bacterium]
MKQRMMRLGRFSAALFLCACGMSGRALCQDAVTPETRRVLARIDQAGKNLTDLTANIKQTKVTLVVNDTSTETGKLFLKRLKNGNRTKLEYEKPEVKTLLIDKGKVLIYEPKIKRLQEIDLGKNRAQAEFLLTGVGQSSANLTKTYDVKFLKEETVNGTKTSLLELKPKSDKVSSMFSQIWLWIDPALGLPIQTRLTESSGDYLTFQLENIKLNPKLSDKIFKLNVPSGVQKIKPLSSR